MASGLGLVLVLLGGFILALSAPTVSNCLSITSNDPNCWSVISTQNRYSSGALGVYLGAIIVTLGVIILAGPSAAKLLRRPHRAGPDPKQLDLGPHMSRVQKFVLVILSQSGFGTRAGQLLHSDSYFDNGDQA